MWCSATSSSLAAERAVPFLVLLAALAASPAAARVLITQDEALALAFPGCEVEREPGFLTDAQQERAGELAGAPVTSALVHRHVARKEGRLVGTAYFDTHRVRTLPETLMIVVDPDGTVRRVEVLSFDEPEDYLPRGGWYGQFSGRGLDGELALKRGIRPVTGATLTARATTAAVRRALAVHRVLQEARREPSADPPAPDEEPSR